MRGRGTDRHRGIGLTAIAGLAAILFAIPGWRLTERREGTVIVDGATLAAQGAPAGMVVTSLATGGMAARAGLRVGNVIDAIDGHAVSSSADMLLMGDDRVALLHVAARGAVGAHTLLLRRPEGESREDPDRRGR